MFLDKVKDLEQIKLGKNQVLVELVYKKQETGNIIIASDVAEASKELIKTVVVASDFEGVSVGDILIEYRMMLGQNGMLKLGDRAFAIVAGFDIKIWTDPTNYDETAEPEVKKPSLIQQAKQGLKASDLRKIESEAKGLGSKYFNNKD